MARIGNTLLSLGLTAGAPIAANTFVGFDDNPATVAGQKVKGVAEYPALAAGDTIAATAKGTAFVYSGGVVNKGDPIVSDTQGRAVTAPVMAIAAGATAVTSTAANGAVLTGAVPPQYIVGYALLASTGAGQLIEILLA